MSQHTLPCTPPPTKKKPSRMGSFFSYRYLVFPKKCPQREACTFRRYSGSNTQKRGFEHIYSNHIFINLTFLNNNVVNCPSKDAQLIYQYI